MRNTLVKITLLVVALLMLTVCFASCNTTTAPSGSTGTTESSDTTTESSDVTDSSNITDNSGTTDSSNVTDNSGNENEDTTNSSGTQGGVDSGDGFTVKFDTSRAQDGITVPNQTVAANGKITAPDYTPYRKGSEFLGWCVNGVESQVWDFENDVVTGNITLIAVFSRPGGNTSSCEHNFEEVEYVAPTCQLSGRRVLKCTICLSTQRYTKDNDPTLAKLEHLELVETVEPTCATDGYTMVYCPNGCGLSKTTTVSATGEHEYNSGNWETSIQPTTYVEGVLKNACTKCGGAVITKTVPYNAEKENFYNENVNISFLYTGGSYVNEPFVNISALGRILVSSYFDGTKGYNVIDGDDNSFWNADTYIDGAKYTDDWVELEFGSSYDVGAIKFLLPNYSAWELGEGCYVSYDLEYWDEEAQSWVYIGEVSDKNAVAVGMKCEMLIELDQPINTNKIRAKVTHASRYAPAVIYEITTFAKAAGTERVPLAIHAQASVSVSGKYNEWASGGGALNDNTTATYWYTDARYNSEPWALYEFSGEKYLACVQVSIAATRNRTFKLEGYQDGEWFEIGVYAVPEAGQLGGNVVAYEDGICTFNIDVEKEVSKLKLTITREPEYWTCYVYDITPYTIVEQYDDTEIAYMGCSHKNPIAGQTVPSTCDTPGYTIMNCACGVTIKTKATDVLGHDWGKYSVDVEATATSLGTKVSICRNEGCTATSTMVYEEKYDAAEVTPYLHNAPAAWAQTFDDGNYLDTYIGANKYLAKYGAHATVMMSITYSDSLVSTWQEHFDAGVFDLGSHSYNHTASYAAGVSPGTLLTEVVNAQYWFRHNFKGQVILGFAAPLGTTSEAVAKYLTGPLAANRNGGDTGIFYNTPDQLYSRTVWGDLNSYISKADQTEGEYVFVKKSDGSVYKLVADEEGNESYSVISEYEYAGINLIFDTEAMAFVDKGYGYAGTYHFIEEDYKYEYVESGSYSFDGTSFSFVSDDSGEYKLVKATVGSYEKGVETLVSVGGFTVECLHSLGAGSIYSSYASTISKLEHITRFGVWAPSYNELIQYLKEAQSAKIETVERTDTSITLSVTDGLDDYMFDHAITVKVDIPNGWTSVTATQGGRDIPFVSMDEYSHTKNMANVSCAIEDGYLYIDVVPDCGDVVITMGEKNDGVDDYEEKVTVTFEPGEGTLNWKEYETRVVIGGSLDELPTPERYGYKFLGWYLNEDGTETLDYTSISENVTLYALWEELPQCTDGSYNHSWGNWTPSTDGENEVRVCKKCQAEEFQPIEE